VKAGEPARGSLQPLDASALPPSALPPSALPPTASAPSGLAVSAEPQRTPRFSVRFSEGEAQLALLAPLGFAGGVLRSLVVATGPAPRVVDFSRGWRALAQRRGTVRSLELSLDVQRLGFAPSRELGWWVASTAEERLLIERARPWGHVAIELTPSVVGRALHLLPLGARALHSGPQLPLAEIEDVLRGLLRAASEGGRTTPRLDRDRGAIDLGDVLQIALTDALVGHGIRVPEWPTTPPQVRLSGGALLFSVGVSFGSGEQTAALAAQREHARRLAPLLWRACEGASSTELEGTEASALTGELRAGLGLPVSADLLTSSAARALDGVQIQLTGTDPRALIAAVHALDAVERAPGLATDVLLAALGPLGSDVAASRELIARALLRSPSRPEVLAASLELAASLTDAALSREVLRDLERHQSGPRADPWLDVALARAEERLGDQDAALERWERASRSPLTLPETFEGLARQLVRRGRLGEALAALERAAELYQRADRRTSSARAQLAAARIALAGGEPHAARERLTSLLDAGTDDAALLQELVAFSARVHRACGDVARADQAEGTLAQHVDRAGMDASDDAVSALLEAARGAMSDDAGARADALLDVVARVRPGDPRGVALREGEQAALLAQIETSTERATLARTAADKLRARGRLADACRVLLRAGELERDLTLLRVAIDLAERSGATLFGEALDRTLAVVGDGPARAALEARRNPR